MNDFVAQKARIAVVEDDPYMRDLLVDYLNQSYAIDVFENPKMFVDQYKQGALTYSLIITDYNMPEMTGEGLIKSLKNSSAQMPPILIISAAGEMNSLFALRLGAGAFLRKPFKLSDLASSVQNLVKSGSSDRDSGSLISKRVLG